MADSDTTTAAAEKPKTRKAPSASKIPEGNNSGEMKEMLKTGSKWFFIILAVFVAIFLGAKIIQGLDRAWNWAFTPTTQEATTKVVPAPANESVGVGQNAPNGQAQTGGAPEQAAPAAPPVDPNVARFNQMAPTRNTRHGPVHYDLSRLDIPEKGLKSCEERGGQIVPGPGRYNPRTKMIDGKNICTADVVK